MNNFLYAQKQQQKIMVSYKEANDIAQAKIKAMESEGKNPIYFSSFKGPYTERTTYNVDGELITIVKPSDLHWVSLDNIDW